MIKSYFCRISSLTLLISATLFLPLPKTAVAEIICQNTQQGRICTIKQAIVSGTQVSVQNQKNLGLVTVGGGCSGTLLNKFWVLTADHCVTTTGTIGGPTAQLTNVPITAAWSTRRIIPSRFVRNWFGSGRDVALVFLGSGNFGAENQNIQVISNSIQNGQTLTKFGRGISAYATGTSPKNAVPAVNDGRYRSALFNVSNLNNSTFRLNVNATGQVGNGGDSGGPDFVTANNGIFQGIAGVQSTCIPTGRVPGMPTTWTWVTNIASCNSARVDVIASTLNQIISEGNLVSNDFNNDGFGDILWHNESTGETQIWLMRGASRIGRATVNAVDGGGTLVGLPWRSTGTNDFNNDGNTDILWHNAATGETQIWLMRGASRIGRATVNATLDGGGALVGLPWSIVGTNDFNRDGNTDILWHNAVTGETQIWLMRGASRIGRATVNATLDGGGALVGLPWSIVGTNDFNRDGNTDILWHNAVTGETQIWLMRGASRIGRATVNATLDGGGALVGLPWSIVGTNDFNRDGNTDILWHNAVTGETQMWLMRGASRIGRATVNATLDGGGALVGLPWSIINH